MGLDMYLQAKQGDQEVELGYWRKANAIHAWFVEHCGDGIDECQAIPVSRKDLEALKQTVAMVLIHPHRASVLLPTQDGFFFGGTEYDDYYFQKLRYTDEVITKALATDYPEFVYQASW